MAVMRAWRNGLLNGNSILTTWRSYFYNLLVDAERVISPSQDTLNRVKKYMPDANFTYLPHPEQHTVNVLVLGMMSPPKGAWQLESCARDAKRRKLPISFKVLGYACYEKLPVDVLGSSEPDLPVSFSGRYQDHDLPDFIASEQADIIYFPVQCPETYSYTLSAALRSGLPIVAPKLGAFIERLSRYPNAHMIEWNSPPQIVNDLLINVMASRKSVAESSNFLHDFTSAAMYLEQYTAAIKRPQSCRYKKFFNT
jgi:hypothetical protein